MSDKPDNFDLPSSWMPLYEAPSREGLKTFPTAKDISASDVVEFDNIKGAENPEGKAAGGDGHAPYQSRFKGWVRTVALVVVLVFLPEQASWAFNYNPMTLWGSKDQPVVSVPPDASADEVVSARIAASVNQLLNQIAYKENTRVQLQLSDNRVSNPELSQRKLLIDSSTVFTQNRIRRITEWLQEPSIHPLNCGVYALKDILASYDVDASLEELSVSSLMVDLISDIVRPGEEKLKTSLFAISKIVDAYGIDLKAAKLEPANVVQLNTPFIANFDSEHFVTVKAIDDAQVYYSDIGREQVASKTEFIAQLSGFVLAPDLERQTDIAFEYVPDSMTPFVWGNKWVDKSDDLPGILSTGELIVGAVITAVTSFVGGAIGNVAISTILGTFAFSMGSSSFSGSLGEAIAVSCINNGGDAEACTSKANAWATGVSIGLSLGAAGLTAGSGGGEAKVDFSNFDWGAAIRGMATQGAIMAAEYGYAKVLDAALDKIAPNMDQYIKDGIVGISSSLAAQVTVLPLAGLIFEGTSAVTYKTAKDGTKVARTTAGKILAKLGSGVKTGWTMAWKSAVAGLAGLLVRLGMCELGELMVKGQVDENGKQKKNPFAGDSMLSQAIGMITQAVFLKAMEKGVLAEKAGRENVRNQAEQERTKAQNNKRQELESGREQTAKANAEIAKSQFFFDNPGVTEEEAQAEYTRVYEGSKAEISDLEIAKIKAAGDEAFYACYTKENVDEAVAEIKMYGKIAGSQEKDKAKVTIGSLGITEGSPLTQTQIDNATAEYGTLMAGAFSEYAKEEATAAINDKKVKGEIESSAKNE
ncbi:MAG: cysteine peptidase family C39 domain-containing protein, partial [Candidatus Omnitrophota bacterium]